MAVEFASASAGINPNSVPQREEVERLIRRFNLPVAVSLPQRAGLDPGYRAVHAASKEHTREAGMDHKYATYEKKGRVAYVTINRPEVMNALHADASRELSDIWTGFRDDDEA